MRARDNIEDRGRGKDSIDLTLTSASGKVGNLEAPCRNLLRFSSSAIPPAAVRCLIEYDMHASTPQEMMISCAHLCCSKRTAERPPRILIIRELQLLE